MCHYPSSNMYGCTATVARTNDLVSQDNGTCLYRYNHTATFNMSNFSKDPVPGYIISSPSDIAYCMRLQPLSRSIENFV